MSDHEALHREAAQVAEWKARAAKWEETAGKYRSLYESRVAWVGAAEARVKELEDALERFADEDKWAEPKVATCGCRFTEWCDDESDTPPWQIARAALNKEGADRE